MQFKHVKCIAAILIGLFLVGSARAEPVTIHYAGQISAVQKGTIPIGTPFAGTITYDTKTKGTPVGTGGLLYHFPISGTFTVWLGSQSYTYQVQYVAVLNQSGTSDTMQVLATDVNTNLTITGLAYVASPSHMPAPGAFKKAQADFHILTPDQSVAATGEPLFAATTP